MLENCMVKGSKNKVKIGQKVKAKQSLVDWHSSHLSWAYGSVVHDDNAYNKDEKEIKPENLQDVYLWSLAKLSGKMPTGIVTYYGADGDWDDRKQQNVRGLKCLQVEFTFKTELGNLKYSTYVSERDLQVIKKKS